MSALDDIKLLMSICPIPVLLIFIVSIWTCVAMLLQIRGRYEGMTRVAVGALWLISIIVLAVGFGVFVCYAEFGTGVFLLTALMVIGSTTAVYVVVDQTVSSGAEEDDYNFSLNTRHNQEEDNLFRETFLIHKNTEVEHRTQNFDPDRVCHHQQQKDQRELTDRENTATDFAKTRDILFDLVFDMQHGHEMLDRRLTSLDGKLDILLLSMLKLTTVLCKTKCELRRDSRDLTCRVLISPSGLDPAVPE